MTLPSDPKLTKLRILAERADKKRIESDVDYRFKWLEYVRYARTLGYCAACEERLTKCRCVLQGSDNREWKTDRHFPNGI